MTLHSQREGIEDQFDFCVTVAIRDLGAAGKFLLRAQRKSKSIVISMEGKEILLSSLQTARRIAASGRWIKPVSVDIRWLKALVAAPPEGTQIVIRMSGSRLFAGSFSVLCSIAATPASNGGSE